MITIHLVVLLACIMYVVCVWPKLCSWFISAVYMEQILFSMLWECFCILYEPSSDTDSLEFLFFCFHLFGTVQAKMHTLLSLFRSLCVLCTKMELCIFWYSFEWIEIWIYVFFVMNCLILVNYFLFYFSNSKTMYEN